MGASAAAAAAAAAKEVRQLRYLVAACLFLTVAFALPALYLLRRSQPGSREDQVPVENVPGVERLRDDSGCDTRNKPRAHLSGEPMKPDPKCIPGKLQTLHWRNDRRPGDQITYQNGSLTVPQDGDYFVYAQVAYLFHDGISRRIMYCGVNISLGISVEQVIFKKSATYDSKEKEKLRIGSTIGKKEKWKTTLYLGGVVQLRGKDQIMVKVVKTFSSTSPSFISPSANNGIAWVTKQPILFHQVALPGKPLGEWLCAYSPKEKAHAVARMGICCGCYCENDDDDWQETSTQPRVFPQRPPPACNLPFREEPMRT